MKSNRRISIPIITSPWLSVLRSWDCKKKMDLMHKVCLKFVPLTSTLPVFSHEHHGLDGPCVVHEQWALIWSQMHSLSFQQLQCWQAHSRHSAVSTLMPASLTSAFAESNQAWSQGTDWWRGLFTVEKQTPVELCVHTQYTFQMLKVARKNPVTFVTFSHRYISSNLCLTRKGSSAKLMNSLRSMTSPHSSPLWVSCQGCLLCVCLLIALWYQILIIMSKDFSWRPF